MAASVLAVVPIVAPAAMLATAAPVTSATALAVAASPPLDSGEQPVAGEVTSVSGLGCMDNKGGNNPLNGSTNPVQLSNCNLAVNTGSIGKQLWTVEPDSTIRMFFPWDPARALSTPPEVATGPYKCLHADSDSTVELWDCNGSNWEDWTFQPVGNEYVLKVTGQFSSGGGTVTKCLAEQGTGAQLAMVSCDPNVAAQQWNIPANTAVHQAAPAMLALNSYYDHAGGLFVDPTGSPERCTQSSRWNYITNGDVQEYGGNCWWWAANALYSMVDFLEHAGGAWLGSGSIADDISNTYYQICYVNNVNTCPTSSLGSQNLKLTNLFQNNYFDDTANWALFWLNAYEYTVSQGSGNSQYLYLAENLWHYITQYGWDLKSENNLWDCNYPGGIVQSEFSTDTAKNLGVNSLYLRLSAWLYLATGGDATFRDGISTSGSPDYGGYVQEANWLFPASPVPQADLTLFDSSGLPTVPMPLIFYGELMHGTTRAAQCSVPPGNAKETQHEGMMIGALVDLYNAGAPGQLNYDKTFYLAIADNLAETMMTDYARSPTFQPGPPAVTVANVLNESGDSLDHEATEPWGDEITGSEAWIPGKGIFVRDLYCLGTVPIESSALPSGKIASFIHTNATSIVQHDQNLDVNASDIVLNYNEFGYWWQHDPYASSGDGPLSFQAELSAAEPIAADMDTTATAMC
jgi:hypothetical protein